MNDTVEIQEKVFREYSGLVRALADVGSVEELLDRQHQMRRLSELFSFLKIYSEEQALFNSDNGFGETDNQIISLENDFAESATVYQETGQDFSPGQSEALIDSKPEISEIEPGVEETVDGNVESSFDENSNEEISTENPKELENQGEFADSEGFIEQEVIDGMDSQERLDNDSHKFKPEIQAAPLDMVTDSFGIDFQADEVFTEDLNDDNSKFSKDKFAEESYNNSDDLKNQTFSNSLADENVNLHTDDEAVQETESQSEKQKRIKLAQIRNLQKNTPSLFDEINEPEEKRPVAKANMPLEAMEAPKPRPDFRLDLNDRITFSKKLFGGSQMELNEAINELNSFKTADEAREYLSEIYYERNWKKCDDVAQRLWNLVENKFL